MGVCRINPLSDPRWPGFIEKHPMAGVFHTCGWLEALRRTYGYEPVAYADLDSNGEIAGAIPFCRISSLVTGRRLVSLPFSDHCRPLVADDACLRGLIAAATEDIRRERLRYLELRPLSLGEGCGLQSHLPRSREAVWHCLDLRRGRDDILRGFHKSCILRKIRSGREDLRIEEGRSDSLIEKFYRLMVITRRRLRLPPQPLAWFRNLAACLDEKLMVRLLWHGDAPVAGAVTLSFRGVVTYKYSCSDSRFNSLGGTVHLIWKIIQDAIQAGATDLDFGRSDLDAPGLIAFKDHWGASKMPLVYYRFPEPVRTSRITDAASAAGRRLLAAAPDSMLTAVGGLLYRHVG